MCEHYESPDDDNGVPSSQITSPLQQNQQNPAVATSTPSDKSKPIVNSVPARYENPTR